MISKPFFSIIGMHRSGTSFITKYLKTCGIYLGINLNPYKYISVGNLEGNWENSEFLEISEELLKCNNGNWHEPPTNIEIPKEISAKFNTFFIKLSQEAPLCSGVKDPRLILFMDKINHLIPQESNFIGIFRNPLKVAESLKIRNGFSYEKSLDIWLNYNKKLLDFVKKGNVYLLCFDWPTEKLFLELENIVKKANLIYFNPDEIYKNKLIRSDLQYNKSYELSENIKNIYSELEKYSQLNDSVNIKSIQYTDADLPLIMKKMFLENSKLSNQIVELIKERKLNMGEKPLGFGRFRGFWSARK